MTASDCRVNTLVAVLLFACAGRDARAVPPDDLPAPTQIGDPEVPPEHGTVDTKKDESRGSLVVAPLPVSSPAVGTGVVPIIGYIFPFNRNDRISPPSVLGVGGLFTSNGTRAYAAYAALNLKEDRLEITAAYVWGNLNYDLYGPGVLSATTGPRCG